MGETVWTLAGIDKNTNLSLLQSISEKRPVTVEWAFHHNPARTHDSSAMLDASALKKVLQWKDTQRQNGNFSPHMALHVSGAAANELLERKKRLGSNLYDIAIQFDRIQFDIDTDMIGHTALQRFILLHPEKTVTTLHLPHHKDKTFAQFMCQPVTASPVVGFSRIKAINDDIAQAIEKASRTGKACLTSRFNEQESFYNLMDSKNPEHHLYTSTYNTDAPSLSPDNHEILLCQHKNKSWQGLPLHYRHAYDLRSKMNASQQIFFATSHAGGEPYRLQAGSKLRDDADRFSLALAEEWLNNLSKIVDPEAAETNIATSAKIIVMAQPVKGTQTASPA